MTSKPVLIPSQCEIDMVGVHLWQNSRMALDAVEAGKIATLLTAAPGVFRAVLGQALAHCGLSGLDAYVKAAKERVKQPRIRASGYDGAVVSDREDKGAVPRKAKKSHKGRT